MPDKPTTSMNRHEFQLAARAFRAGRLSLSEFTEKVIPDKADGVRPATDGHRDPCIQLPHRAANAHKGACGHVLIVGGSHAMPGAAALAGLGALRGGAGLVTVASCTSVAPTVASISPCLMTLDLGELANDQDTIMARDRLLPMVNRATVVALGPGWGSTDPAKRLTAWLYATLAAPLVVDADGLNNLATSGLDLSDHAGPRIWTPHVGEFRRLAQASGCEMSASAPRAELERLARELAAVNRVIVVLKGPPSLVTDGQREYRNTTGNAGLATAGTGDVLTGLIAALIAQGLDHYTAAATGCWLHGTAGDCAQQKLGIWSMIATDVIDSLGNAFQELAGPS